MNKADYNKEMYRQLNDGETYERLRGDPTNKYKKELSNLINAAKDKNVVCEKERKYLDIQTPKIPVIYYLPKVHKSTTLVEYVDIFLQPLVKKMNSYIRDSQFLIDILKQLKIDNLEEVLICTCDVSSLYTTIPQNLGLEVIRERLVIENELREDKK